MHTLKFKMEYKCYPIWEYDEKDELIDNCLPKNIEKDKYITDLLTTIQKAFDNLFINEKGEEDFFNTKFKSKKEKDNFISNLTLAKEYLINRYQDLYKIECNYDINSFE